MPQLATPTSLVFLRHEFLNTIGLIHDCSSYRALMILELLPAVCVQSSTGLPSKERALCSFLNFVQLLHRPQHRPWQHAEMVRSATHRACFGESQVRWLARRTGQFATTLWGKFSKNLVAHQYVVRLVMARHL